MGTLGASDAIQATVADVNQQQKTVKLRMHSGEMVELKIPEQSLMNLHKGDSVQVSIRKAEASSSGAAAPAQPGVSTPGTNPAGSGTRSR
jgi:hypothetical protein